MIFFAYIVYDDITNSAEAESKLCDNAVSLQESKKTAAHSQNSCLINYH